VQLASVGQLWLKMPKDTGFKQQESAADTLFQFSDHVNVVLMVIDTFQSDLFPDILRQHPDLEAAFDGFTYFRNALSGSDGTIVSVPIMLTANSYDNSVPYLEYVKTSFLGNSLPKTLREYGFAVDLFPLLGYTVYTDFSGLPFGGKKLRDWRAFAREQAFLLDLALFRSAPQPLKRLVYNRQHWLLAVLLEDVFDRRDAGGAPSDEAGGSAEASTLKYAEELENMQILVNKNRDPRFIMNMIGQSGVMRGRDAFKFIHLKGLHLPLIMNEDLDYEEMEPYRDNMLRQGAGMLKIAATFLERLEQLGVYDDSLVFIVADHGSGVADAKINPTPYGDGLNRGGPYPGNFRSFKAAGIPLVLVKRLNARGPLATSGAPVALGDIPRTVAEELGLKADFPGRSMFSVADGEPRERIYRAFIGPQIDVEYLAPLLEYAVVGDSWDDTSWRETGNVYYAPKE
ncbi:MAG TPA: sulfatase-like hydrolase/transferase, partial [Desulfobacterales bacterium]|nr:sulfatase-like hydrolase/transferase [Desulfobacterales bacterium]